jgi:CBS domain-containing protein
MNRSEFEEAYEDKELIRGEILTTPIGDLSLRTPILVDAEATLATAVNAMNEHRTGCVLVQRDGKLVGIFTERDVLTKVIFRDNNRSWKVEQVMTKDPETLEPTATVAHALNMMSVGGYRHIPIVDRAGQPVGVLSLRDVADFVVDLFPDGVFNLPPSPDKSVPKTVDGG